MSQEDPVENSSTEKRTSPHKTGIRLFLHRAQKTVENGFLHFCCCCQDSVECFVPPPSKPHYAGLESTETQTEDTTPGSDVTCISEQRTESLSVQSRCSDFVLPGEVPVEIVLHETRANITTIDITSIGEDNVEKIDKCIHWKKTRSFFRRAREALKLPLLCGGVDAVESLVPLTDSTDSTEAQCGDSTQTLDLEELSDGTLSGSESIPDTMLPGDVVFEPAEASEKPTEWSVKERICYCLKKAWTGIKQHFLFCGITCARYLRLTADSICKWR
ncbi:uncharacterized protein LOC125258834 isoform X1 [Megalobrama amblycephala]|uniref:uncharacterized protein LOC125258834 isoform X1 n=1 Tax=Megalobrama amblycephala TaxID=75352 RepID=UPI0020140D29|nr:uncharacterized protein LOC125258834 isoform X1 [Megalobrama amblycephala]